MSKLRAMNMNTDMPSKVIVFTGGTSGLGLSALIQLLSSPAGRRYRVILGSRSTTIPPALGKVLVSTSGRHTLDLLPLDLASPSSIHFFASRILADLPSTLSIDSLVLCAGIAVHGQRRVVALGIEGREVEETMFVNTLSEALLIRLLLPRMTSDQGRIVFVGSALHRKAAVRGVSPGTLDKMLGAEQWDTMLAYQTSKLAQMHLMFITQDEIAKRAALETSQAPLPHVSVIIVSPGFVPQTGLFHEFPWYQRLAMKYIVSRAPFATSLEAGGEAIIRAIADSEIPSGTYFSRKGTENPADECMNAEIRKAWEAWFIEHGVWESVAVGS